MKVLLVQEAPFLATTLKLTMLLRGFDLIVTEDTVNASAVLNTVNPSIVVTDISKGEGLDYIMLAKEKNMPVIVISENGQEADLQLAFDQGADDYLSLPLSFSELALRVSILTRSLAA